MLTRNVQLNIRVTPEEKKLFEQAATRCGLTLSQYIRMRLRNQMPRPLPTADYRQVLDKKTYRALQDASDELCREQGLSVVDKKDAHRVPRNLYLAEKAGEPTRYNVMRQDIDLAILRSETPRDLPRILRKMGYEVDFNPNHKYPTIKLPHDRRAVRFKTLGEEYTPQAMAQRIQQNHDIGIFKRMEIYYKRYPPVHPHYQKLRQDFRKAIMEAFGIYRT